MILDISNPTPIHVSHKKMKASQFLDIKLQLLPSYSSTMVSVEWVFEMSWKISTN